MSVRPCISAITATALALLASAAQADPAQNFVFDPSAPLAISAVGTTGTADVLSGARALAVFNDGHRAEAAFVVSGDSLNRSAVAQSAEFLVAAISDTSRDIGRPQEWFVTNLDPSRTLVGFAIDGHNAGLGQAAFDINFGPTFLEVGTPGSNSGVSLQMDFTGRTFIRGTVTVTYSQPLALNGAPAVGDLFARVDVALAYSNTGLNGGLLPNSVFASQDFSSDLDAVAYLAAAPVPEPAPSVLLLAGAAALALRRRKG